jgi:hypothetical protein
MRKFLVTYHDAIRKVEMSATIQARNLASATAKEQKAMAVINESHPNFSIKSIVEVA